VLHDRSAVIFEPLGGGIGTVVQSGKAAPGIRTPGTIPGRVTSDVITLGLRRLDLRGIGPASTPQKILASQLQEGNLSISPNVLEDLFRTFGAASKPLRSANPLSMRE